MTATFRTAAFLMAIASAATARAQVRRPTPKLETQVMSSRVTPGGSARVRLKVALPPGLHVQSDKPRDPSLVPTVLTLTPPAGVSVVRTTYPRPADLRQPGLDQPLAVFSGTFTIDVDVAISRSIGARMLDIPGELRYQSCTDQVCFPPSRAPVVWRVRVRNQ